MDGINNNSNNNNNNNDKYKSTNINYSADILKQFLLQPGTIKN